MMHQASDALFGQRRNSIGLRGVVECVAAVGIVEAEIDVQATAAAIGKGLRHETQQVPASGKQFPGHQAEQENVVDRTQCVSVTQSELELRPVVLGVDRFDRKPAKLRLSPYVVYQSVWVNGCTGSVDERTRCVIGNPLAVCVPLKYESFEFHPHLRVVAHFLPRRHRTFQHAARAMRQALAVALEIRHDHTGACLPARSRVSRLEHRIEIGKSFQHHGPGRRYHLAIVAEGVYTDAMPSNTGIRHRTRQVLAPSQVEMIAKQHANALVIVHLIPPVAEDVEFISSASAARLPRAGV